MAEVSTTAYTSASKVMSLDKICQFSNQVVPLPPRESGRVFNLVACKDVDKNRRIISCMREKKSKHATRSEILFVFAF